MAASPPMVPGEPGGTRAAADPGLCVLAVDDEAPALEELVFLLRSDARIGSVHQAGDSATAIRLLLESSEAGTPVDGVFLDLRMPGLNGLDLARAIAQFGDPPSIVFVTAYEDCAVDAFKLKALDYVLKPIRVDRLAEAIGRIDAARRRIPVPDPVRPAAPDPARPGITGGVAGDTVPVELGGVTKFVAVTDVRHVESCGDYVRLHTGQGSGLIRAALTDLEDRWKAAGFMRVHRSYLVAIKYVDELRLVGGQLTVIVGGVQLPVSRRHVRELRDLLVRGALPGAGRAGPS